MNARSEDPYAEIVGSKFRLFNSLFLNLPFQNVLRTGTLLPLLQQHCAEGFEKGLKANEIIHDFFKEHAPNSTAEEQLDFQFNIITRMKGTRSNARQIKATRDRDNTQ